MRWTLTVGLLGTVLLATPAVAQEIPSVVANPDMMDRELDRRANAATICWRRGAPRSVDWMAQGDPSFRLGVFNRYGFQETGDGWRWFRGEITAGPDLRPMSDAQVKGETAVDLDVHHGHATGAGWASFVIDGPLKYGIVRFDWTLPPERVCMANPLSLEARVQVMSGDPGAHKIMFVLPLDQEQLAAEGSDVKACSPSASTAIDSEIGFTQDAGNCKRGLFQLRSGESWDLWLSLPESFYVVYPYEPDLARRR